MLLLLLLLGCAVAWLCMLLLWSVLLLLGWLTLRLLSMLLFGPGLLMSALLPLRMLLLSPCCSCLRKQEAATPRSKDRMAVLVILITFMGAASIAADCMRLLTASFLSLRSPGYR